jgi:hypothetical protein
MLQPQGYFFGKVCHGAESRRLTVNIYNFNRILGRAEERVAKLVDSPDRPESEASYKLDEGGWSDV